MVSISALTLTTTKFTNRTPNTKTVTNMITSTIITVTSRVLIPFFIVVFVIPTNTFACFLCFTNSY